MGISREELIRKMEDELSRASHDAIYYWIQGNKFLSNGYELTAQQLEADIYRMRSTTDQGA